MGPDLTPARRTAIARMLMGEPPAPKPCPYEFEHLLGVEPPEPCGCSVHKTRDGRDLAKSPPRRRTEP